MEIDIKNKDDFINELFNQMSTLLKSQKGDIIEYLIYLFNKYDKNNFFYKNTNKENARLLKVTPEKLKLLVKI